LVARRVYKADKEEILLKSKFFKIITNQVKFLLVIVAKYFKQYYLYMTCLNYR